MHGEKNIKTIIFHSINVRKTKPLECINEASIVSNTALLAFDRFNITLLRRNREEENLSYKNSTFS